MISPSTRDNKPKRVPTPGGPWIVLPSWDALIWKDGEHFFIAAATEERIIDWYTTVEVSTAAQVVEPIRSCIETLTHRSAAERPSPQAWWPRPGKPIVLVAQEAVMWLAYDYACYAPVTAGIVLWEHADEVDPHTWDQTEDDYIVRTRAEATLQPLRPMRQVHDRPGTICRHYNGIP